MSEDLQAVEVETGHAPGASIIWLHGLGADGHDFAPVVPQLNLRGPVRFIFPHAPVRRVTINGGMPMRAWYDIVSLDRAGPEDESGIRESAASVSSLIDMERNRGVPCARILLAGFSQGGAIALHLALRYPEALGGVLALSSYLPLPQTLAAEGSAANAAIPAFLAHGSEDDTVPETLGQYSRSILEQRGCLVDWHSYPMGHTVCPEELSDLSLWLHGRLEGSVGA